MAGIVLPHSLASSACARAAHREVAAGIAVAAWVAVPEGQRRPLDVLLFRTSSRACSHVGLVVSRRHFLHACQGRGKAVLERYNGLYGAKIQGAYRWHSLM